jgi:hypothetical protein
MSVVDGRTKQHISRETPGLPSQAQFSPRPPGRPKGEFNGQRVENYTPGKRRLTTLESIDGWKSHQALAESPDQDNQERCAPTDERFTAIGDFYSMLLTQLQTYSILRRDKYICNYQGQETEDAATTGIVKE